MIFGFVMAAVHSRTASHAQRSDRFLPKSASSGYSVSGKACAGERRELI
jgi:hypothetical protein